MKPKEIRLEYGKASPGAVCIIEGAQPMIGWALAGGATDRQSACRAVVLAGERPLWDTGWVETAEQSLRYAGPPLEAGEVYSLEVWVKDGAGKAGGPARQAFCPGTLAPWPAAWVCEAEQREDTVPTFVRNISCGREVAAACLFVATLGYHKVHLNGREVFGLPLNPAFSEYEKRAYYTVLPGLEGVLAKGENRLAVTVAAGWRSPHNVCYRHVKRVADYAGSTQMSAALRIRYRDGGVEWVCTGEDWQYFYGPTVYSNLFIGERHEAARAVPGFSLPGTALGQLVAAAKAPAPGGRLAPQTLAPVRPQEVYPARTVTEVAPGVYGVDFGQNIAGVCRLRIPQDIPGGQVVEVSHAEVLDEAGRLYLAPLRLAASVDSYTAAGDGRDPAQWQPEFTYHGFRYAEVRGWPGPLQKEDICAVSLYTDVALDGFFTSGSALVNAIQKNVVQTEKANIHSILTDCPQRDERMGWMNDATVRYEETPYNFDVGRLLPKVVRDCMDVQDAEGAITCTAPFAFGSRPADPVCSSYLVAGWECYRHTGNADILREGYPGFKAWNAFLESKSEGYIVQYSYYGDWAGPAYACAAEESAVSAVTPGILMSTGYFYYNAVLLAQMAEAIGQEAEAALHREKAEQIRQAFLAKWWDEASGRVGSGSQGCQAFALWLDILPEAGRQRAADVLHEDLVQREYRFTTGNLCTRYLMDALSRYGYLEDAWALITREEYPSLGYMIQNEATTVWERFELKKDPGMNSHNHPMYGAVGYWFYACLAGVRPTQPGWRAFSVAPQMPEKLLSANAAVPTPYGEVSVRWVKRYGEAHLYVGVPLGATAQVRPPWGGLHSVGPGFHHWSGAL